MKTFRTCVNSFRGVFWELTIGERMEKKGRKRRRRRIERRRKRRRRERRRKSGSWKRNWRG